MVYKLNVCGLK